MGRNRQKPELIFEPLDHSHLPVLKSWFSDSDTKRWVEEPSDRLVSYINSEPQYYAWIAAQEIEGLYREFVSQVPRLRKTT